MLRHAAVPAEAPAGPGRGGPCHHVGMAGRLTPTPELLGAGRDLVLVGRDQQRGRGERGPVWADRLTRPCVWPGQAGLPGPAGDAALVASNGASLHSTSLSPLRPDPGPASGAATGPTSDYLKKSRIPELSYWLGGGYAGIVLV